jgi:predicted phage terminase large subunit-like protein
MVIVDEAAHIRGLEDIWNQELRPALSDRQGRGVFISTPAGHNFFYRLFLRRDDGWQSWQYPTWSNPYVAQAEIDQARRELPALVFRQEYGAEFVQLEGAMFRREMFRVLSPGHVPPVQRAVRHWDIAASARNYADFSVGAKIGITEDGVVIIMDVVRGRWEWPSLLRVIRDTALADGTAVQQSIESVGVQRGLIDLLSAEPTLAGVALRAIEPVGDKIMRAQPVLARAEQGKLALVSGAWNGALIDEFCAFPAGEHDDQVDAVSGGLVALGRSSGGIYV